MEHNWDRYGGYATDPNSLRTKADWDRAAEMPWGTTADDNLRWMYLKQIERYDPTWAERIIKDKDYPSVHFIPTDLLKKTAEEMELKWANDRDSGYGFGVNMIPKSKTIKALRNLYDKSGPRDSSWNQAIKACVDVVIHMETLE